jgi:putative two-component system response regulator
MRWRRRQPAVPGEALKEARILIVDDQETNILLLERLLHQRGFSNLRSTTDPRQVAELCTQFGPDLILLDLHMPNRNGFEVLQDLRPHLFEGSYLPVLVLTADVTPEAKERALSIGAKDFLTKPFDLVEAGLRIENLIETRYLHLRLQDQNVRLEERVAERTRELEEAGLEIIARLALATEYRDDDTHRHTQRVGRTSALLAQGLGLPVDTVELLAGAAPLHDVGKIGIPDPILLKPGRLTPEEYEVVKTHTSIGSRILSGSRFPLLQLAAEIALTHHEWWDGAGYGGLRQDAIPLSGRVVAVADAFDAMTHDRPYRGAARTTDAVAEIERMSGSQFDPAVVEAFLALDPEDLM